MKEQRKQPQKPLNPQPKWQPNPQQPTREKEQKRENNPHQPQKKWQEES